MRAAQIARRLPRAARGNKPHLAALCEVAQMLTERLGFPAPVQKLFVHLTERWDGKGQLGRAKRDEIPLPLRITHVARDAAFQRLLGGEEYAARVVRERAGHAFDPRDRRRDPQLPVVSRRAARAAADLRTRTDATGHART